MRICTNCGTTNTDGVRACKNCGSPIKTVNSVVVRTHYRKNKKATSINTKSSDFNPVQHLQKTTTEQNSPLQSTTPNVSNLEYKFHSPNQNQNSQPLKSIPPTPANELVIPKPIQSRRRNRKQVAPSPPEETSPIVLSGNTITGNDLQSIPKYLPAEQAQIIKPVSVPRVGEKVSQVPSNANNTPHPIMAFSSQSMHSQQIEQEMTSAMSTLKGTSAPPQVPKEVRHDEIQDHSIPNSLNDILINLSQLDLNIETSALVNMDGKIIASAKSERIDEFLISTITNTLGTISQDVIASLESGDLKFISIFATKGILFLSPIMKNVFLVLYTSSDAKIGLINLARMVVKKKIELFYAKQNLRKSPI